MDAHARTHYHTNVGLQSLDENALILSFLSLVHVVFFLFIVFLLFVLVCCVCACVCACVWHHSDITPQYDNMDAYYKQGMDPECPIVSLPLYLALSVSLPRPPFLSLSVSLSLSLCLSLSFSLSLSLISRILQKGCGPQVPHCQSHLVHH